MPALSKYSHIKDWKSADKVLGDNTSKVIGNNTELVRNVDETIGVNLHGHQIINYERGGDTVLSSKGYRTSTTKDRLNRYTPGSVSVVQRSGEWFLKVKGKKHEFRDGMRVF